MPRLTSFACVLRAVCVIVARAVLRLQSSRIPFVTWGFSDGSLRLGSYESAKAEFTAEVCRAARVACLWLVFFSLPARKGLRVWGWGGSGSMLFRVHGAFIVSVVSAC